MAKAMTYEVGMQFESVYSPECNWFVIPVGQIATIVTIGDESNEKRDDGRVLLKWGNGAEKESWLTSARVLDERQKSYSKYFAESQTLKLIGNSGEKWPTLEVDNGV